MHWMWYVTRHLCEHTTNSNIDSVEMSPSIHPFILIWLIESQTQSGNHFYDTPHADSIKSKIAVLDSRNRIQYTNSVRWKQLNSMAFKNSNYFVNNFSEKTKGEKKLVIPKHCAYKSTECLSKAFSE